MIDLRLGDCLEVMKTIPSASIDLTVTSPPYDNLRTYNGFTFDFEGIAQELYRVTKDGGVVVWIVGDATVKGSETGTSFKQALYFMQCGFNLHDTMIWDKNGKGGAKGSNFAYWNGFEYMFVFVKNKICKFNSICDRKNIYGNKTVKASQRKSNGNITSQRIVKIKEYGKRFNIWKISPQSFKNHPAPFPEQLSHDHIISWSNEGDTVLDCFMGSGTTGKMAKQLNRNFIGIEISQEYLDIAKERINGIG
jgi:site-specific DNA-methyltransferase (adenine-specific)